MATRKATPEKVAAVKAQRGVIVRAPGGLLAPQASKESFFRIVTSPFRPRYAKVHELPLDKTA